MLISVIVPAYNEEEAVAKVLTDIADQAYPLAGAGHMLEILLVANACSDDTVKKAQAAMSSYLLFPPSSGQPRTARFDDRRAAAPLFRLLEEPRQGYGWAHRRGMAEAKGDIILTMDCDNTYPAHDIPRIVSEFDIPVVDAVFTNRLTETAAMNRVSRLGNFLLSFLLKMLHSQMPRDSQSGMWAYRREMLAVLFAGVGTGMELSEQTKMRIAGEARRWVDLDIDYYERVGESKLNPFRDGLRCLWRTITTV